MGFVIVALASSRWRRRRAHRRRSVAVVATGAYHDTSSSVWLRESVTTMDEARGDGVCGCKYMYIYIYIYVYAIGNIQVHDAEAIWAPPLPSGDPSQRRS